MFTATEPYAFTDEPAQAAEQLRGRRIVVADRDPRSREALRITISAMGLEIAGLASDGQEAFQLATSAAPDFVLLDEYLPVMNGMETARAINHIHPNVSAVLMTDHAGPTLLRQAMRYCVRDIVARPPDAASLRASLEELEAVHRAHEAHDYKSLLNPALMPRLYCVTGGKGGVGKTMIAANLALALQDRREKTVLVDLYTQFGDVASALAMKPSRTLAELAGMADDVDGPLISGYVEKHTSGLHVLFGSDRPLPLDAIPVPVLDRLISVLKREYRNVVFDVPPYLHATTLHALSLANAVMLVCNLFDYTTIADTKQLFDTLAGGYVSRDRLKLLINRVTPQNRFQAGDLESTFGHPVFAQIPNEPHIVSLLNTGYKTHQAIADSALGEAIRTVADALADPNGAPVPARDAPPAGQERRAGEKRGWKALFGGSGA